MQMGSGLGGAALVVAVLALIVAIALFLISSMNNARLRSEVRRFSAASRRWKPIAPAAAAERTTTISWRR